MFKLKYWLPILLGLALTVLNIKTTKADTFPSFPMAFWGNVTVNGNPAPAGTTITAYYGDTLAGQVVVTEAGVYGYDSSIKQKLLIGQGVGQITFKFKSANINSNQETAGTSVQSYTAFESGKVVNKDLAFTFTVNPPPSGGGGGGGGGGAPYIPPTQGKVLGTETTSQHPNGTLILDGATVYLIKDGKRFGFRNPVEYQSHGYNFKQVVPANNSDKSLAFDQANIIKAMEGTLVLDASDNRTVYMVGMNGTKRGFTSAAVFEGLGYSFSNLPKIDLSDYPAGLPIESSTEAHPEGTLILDHGTVWWIRGSQRQGFESEAVFDTYGFNWGRIVPANASDMALMEGSLVKFRDGTLVNDGGAIYLISDGKKMQFSSVEALSSRGYSLSNAITARVTNYETSSLLN